LPRPSTYYVASGAPIRKPLMLASPDNDDMKRGVPITSNGKMALARCGEMPVCLVGWSHWFGYGRRASELCSYFAYLGKKDPATQENDLWARCEQADTKRTRSGRVCKMDCKGLEVRGAWQATLQNPARERTGGMGCYSTGGDFADATTPWSLFTAFVPRRGNYPWVTGCRPAEEFGRLGFHHSA